VGARGVLCIEPSVFGNLNPENGIPDGGNHGIDWGRSVTTRSQNLARISHQPPAATGDASHPAVVSRLGVLSPPTTAQCGRRLAPRRAHRPRAGDGETQAPKARRNVPQVRAPRPARPGRGPQRRPLRAPWLRIQGAATTAMSLHRRGEATKKAGSCRRNPSGRRGSWPISALLVVDDARASTSSSRLDLDSRDPSADGTGGSGRASGSKTPLGTAPRRPRDETR